MLHHLVFERNADNLNDHELRLLETQDKANYHHNYRKITNPNNLSQVRIESALNLRFEPSSYDWGLHTSTTELLGGALKVDIM